MLFSFLPAVRMTFTTVSAPNLYKDNLIQFKVVKIQSTLGCLASPTLSVKTYLQLKVLKKVYVRSILPTDIVLVQLYVLKHTVLSQYTSSKVDFKILVCLEGHSMIQVAKRLW